MSKFKRGETIKPLLGQEIGFFERCDNPIKINGYHDGMYWWSPRIGSRTQCGYTERMDRQYRLTFWSWISRYFKEKL